MNARVLAVSAFAAVVASASVTHAQVPTSPNELGMGGAYVGVARGYEAIFLAPGNLALSDRPAWSFAVPQPVVGGELRGPEIRDLVDFVDFDELPQTRQDELLALIPADGTEVRYTLRAPLAALTIRGFGVGATFVSVGGHTLSRDLAELMLLGYEEGRTDYAVGNTSGQRASYWDIAGSYGRSIGPVSVGATGHYLHGRTLVQTRLFDPVVDLEAENVEVDYVGVLVRGGTGYALDVGAAIQPHSRITVSGNVSNAFARMTWSEDMKVRSLHLDRDLIDNGEPQDILSEYEDSEVDFDPSSASLLEIETAQGFFDEAYFPAVARMGVAWQPFRRTHLAADYHRKLTDGRFGDAWDQRISVGIQQSLPIISFRAGYSLANNGGNLIGGGLSLGPLDIGVARYQRSDIEGDRTRGWMATFGLGTKQ